MGTPNAPNHGWLTPSDQLTGAVQAMTSSTRRTRSYPSPASGRNSGPRRIHASPEGLLRRKAPPWLSRGLARAGFIEKQPWPYRLTNRPLRRRIKCGGCLTSYPDTRASVGQAEVTAVTSPLLFTVRYDRKTATPATTDNRSRSTTELKPRAQQEALPRPTSRSDLGRRSPPRPTSRSGLGRRSPPRSTPGLGLDPGLGRNHVLTRPWPRPQEKSPPRPTLGSD
jgi:hypothetical protein